MVSWGDVNDFFLGERHRSTFDPSKYQNIEGSQQIRGGLNTLAGEAARRQAPTASTEREDQFRRQQMELGRQMGRVASGLERGPGEMAAERAGQQALRAQLAQASGARGFGAQALRSQLGQQGALMRTNLAGQAGIAGAQDRMQAQGALAGLLAQGRGADQSTALANQQAQIATTGQADAARLGALGQLSNLGLSEQQQRMAAEQWKDQVGMQTQRQGLGGLALQTGAQILPFAL